MKLTALKNIGLQIAGVALSIAAANSGGLTGWQKVAAAAAISGAQAALGRKAHTVNPDGSPATEPYTRPTRRRRKEQ